MEILRAGEFTLVDFKNQLSSLMQPGIMQRLIGLVPEMGDLTKMMGEDNEGDVRRLIGVINSMTPAERRNPKMIDPSRRNRIAQGSGTQTQEVTQLVKQFDFMAPMMKAMAGKGIVDRMQAIQELQKRDRPLG